MNKQIRWCEGRKSECRTLIGNSQAAKVILRVLANEGRMQIMCCLTARERSVHEIMDYTGLRQPAVSQHLAKLRQHGLVCSRREGKEVFYTLGSVRVRDLLNSLDDVFQWYLCD